MFNEISYIQGGAKATQWNYAGLKTFDML